MINTGKTKKLLEFNLWFNSFYGESEDYFNTETEEYYTRKAFALMGWLGKGGELK